MVDRKMLSDGNGKIATETSEARPAPSRSIVLFLLITAALSSIFYAFIIATGHGVTCFAALMLGMSVIMAWLRLRSGSLWTAAVFHASQNQFIQVFFTPATSVRGTKTSFAIDEFGFALPAVVLILAIVFWRLASKPARLRI